MMRAPAVWRAADREGGFALLIVLWTLVLTAFIVTHVTAAGRTEVRIAANLASNAAAQAAADGAIYQAIFNLADPRPDHQWAPDGSERELQIAASRVTLQIEDEAARVNPNLASRALLEGLQRAAGSDAETAADLAGAIAEWIGPARGNATIDDRVAEYRAAGLDYAPPGSPVESIDELGKVPGMTNKLLDALRPHLTLFGPAEPNADDADPVVTAAIDLAGRISSSAGPGVAAAAANADLDLVTARIRATAHGPGGAEVSRAAIVRIGPFNSRGYALLAWGNRVD